MKKSIAVLVALACVAAAPLVAEEFDSLTGWAAAHGHGGTGEEAPGDVLDSFPVGWAASPIGLAFDYLTGGSMWYFHEADPAASIWIVNLDGSGPVAFGYAKLGGPNTDGGSIRPGDGFVYAADFNGDLVAIDDNIYLFDRTGATVAFWETDVGLNGAACVGGSVDQIIDVAVDHSDGCTVYATSNVDNNIHVLDLCDTSGGAGANSPCTHLASIPAPTMLGNAIAIEYDDCNDGYWITDFASENIVLVDNDGTFNTIMQVFVGSGGAGFNTGCSPQDNGADPLPVFVTDFTTLTTTVFDSGTGGCNDCVFGLQGVRARRGPQGVRIDYRATVEHNRAPVQVPVYVEFSNLQGEVLASRQDGPMMLRPGQTVHLDGQIMARGEVPPGTYRLTVRIEGMKGWHVRKTHVQVP